MVANDEWVMLVYRVPREPSTPRISIWRKLRRLGVAQLGDGLVTLPADARTQEQLEWVAQEVVEAGGSSMLWRCRPTSKAQERELASSMRAARAAEYADLADRAHSAARAAQSDQGASTREPRRLRSLRRELREIQRRDFFPPPERDAARRAVAAYAERVLNPDPTGTAGATGPEGARR